MKIQKLQSHRPQESRKSSKISATEMNVSSNITPLDFENFIPWLCTQLQISGKVFVKRKIQDEIILRSATRTSSAKAKFKSPKVKSDNSDSFESTERISNISTTTAVDAENTLFINAYYNTKGQLAEVAFVNCSIEIDKKVIQAINLCLPFHPSLYRFKIKRSLTSSVLYEVSKLLCHNITDLCLDDNFVPEGNYFILLDRMSNLQNLSLRRCYINDEVCIKIADKLNFGYPGSKTLHSLDLSSNRVTDIGAESLGNMLRKNRTLLYLNMADNRITDNGAAYILNSLVCFPLTKDEIIVRNLRILEYFRKKIEIYAEYKNEVISQLRDDEKENICSNRLTIPKPDKDAEKIKAVACCDKAMINDESEIKTKAIVDELKDIFDDKNIIRKDGWIYAVGNLRLSYLNLAYNNLGYLSIRTVYNVLKYQSKTHKSADCRGLLRIILQGNNIPTFCKELVDIEAFLESAVSESVLCFNSTKHSSTIKSGKKTQHKRA